MLVMIILSALLSISMAAPIEDNAEVNDGLLYQHLCNSYKPMVIAKHAPQNVISVDCT